MSAHDDVITRAVEAGRDSYYEHAGSASDAEEHDEVVREALWTAAASAIADVVAALRADAEKAYAHGNATQGIVGHALSEASYRIEGKPSPWDK